MGRSEECAQESAPQNNCHIHSGLNQQDPISSDVFLAHGDQYADGRWWFGSSCHGVNLVFLWVISYFSLQVDFCFCFRRFVTISTSDLKLAL